MIWLIFDSYVVLVFEVERVGHKLKLYSKGRPEGEYISFPSEMRARKAMERIKKRIISEKSTVNLEPFMEEE